MLGLRLVAIESDGDHLHVMIDYLPQVALSDIVRRLKGAFSHFVRRARLPEVLRKLCGRAFWSPSYFVASCGGAPLDVVIGVNYAVSVPETFLSPIDLECRGMVFDRDSGDLVSRAPLHKFFNAGERQLIQDLPIDEDHWFEKKLDGSMIGAFVDRAGELVFHTRGGFSRQARAAGVAASSTHRALIRRIYAAGFTPAVASLVANRAFEKELEPATGKYKTVIRECASI